MLGAIVGDYVGSVHEHAGTKTKVFPLVTPGSGVTDGARQTRLAKSAARRPPPDRTLGAKTVGGRSHTP